MRTHRRSLSRRGGRSPTRLGSALPRVGATVSRAGSALLSTVMRGRLWLAHPSSYECWIAGSSRHDDEVVQCKCVAAPARGHDGDGGSAWPITRLIGAESAAAARARPRRPSRAPSCTVSVGSTWQWKLTISPSAVSRTRTSCTSPTNSMPAAISVSASRTSAMRSGAASRPAIARLQRLDMGLDLDVGPELLAQRRLQPVGDLVRAAEREPAVDLEIERDRQPAADRMHGDMMHRERAVARDHHDALEHGLVVERARLGRRR